MSMQAMEAIQPLWSVGAAADTQSAERADGPTIPFADIFRSTVENVRETDAAKNEAEYLLATGQLDNPAEYTIAAAQALTSVNLLIELRNRTLDAYGELMRISM